MKIDKNIANRLNLERTRRIRDAAQILLEKGDVEGAKETLKWVEVSSQLLAATQRPAARPIWSVIIALFCLLIAGLAWTLHISTTKISLEISTYNASLKLGKNWSARHQFTTNLLYINNVAELNAPGLKLHSTIEQGEDPFAMELSGKGIIVTELVLKEDTNVEFTSNSDKLTLFAKGPPIIGELTVNYANLVLEKGGQTIEKSVDVKFPETIRFRTAQTGAEPVRFELSSNNDWRLRRLRAREMGFLEEYPPGSGIFESGIRSGQVRLLETDVTENLREADRLILEGVKTKRLEIRKADHNVRIFFEGSVTKILVGPPDLEKNLAPTFLEYIYHQKRLAFFWSAVVFLWGLFWSIKNTLFN